MVQKVALADRVIVDGDANHHITILADPNESIHMNIKDARIHNSDLKGSMVVDEEELQEMLP